jgi:hypothetical protein
MWRLLTVLALLGMAATSGLAVGSDLRAPPGSCPVTVPPPRKGSGFGPEGFNYGTAKLRADLDWAHGVLIAGTLPDGGSMAVTNPDGSVRVKVGWWRAAPGGQLHIRGTRIDAPAPPLGAEVGTVSSYGHEGFVPSATIFPTGGCWRVTGTVGSAGLSFVADVTKPPEGVLVDCSTRAQGAFPGAFTSAKNVVVGPIVLVGAAHPDVVRDPGGRQFSQKFQLLVRNGHRVTIELTRAERRGAGLAYGPLPQGEVHLRDTHRVVSFVACKRDSGSRANGRPVTFWAGGVVVRSPRCVALQVWVDAERSPRQVRLPLGVPAC